MKVIKAMEFYTYRFSYNYTHLFLFLASIPGSVLPRKQYETRETLHFISCEHLHASVSQKDFIYTHIQTCKKIFVLAAIGTLNVLSPNHLNFSSARTH